MAAYAQNSRVEPLAYTPSEVEGMFGSMNRLILNALRDGRVLLDCGPWSILQQRYRSLISSGDLVEIEGGWSWTDRALQSA